MRSRYVGKCKCNKAPEVIKELCVLNKGVIDIEVSVKCSICNRPYKEVGPKRTRMIDSEIVKEIITIPEELLNGRENPGELGKENEGTDRSFMEEEQDGPEQDQKDESENDAGLQSDENSEKSEIKEKKTFKERLLGKGNKPVPDRGTDIALEESGVPKEDLW